MDSNTLSLVLLAVSVVLPIMATVAASVYQVVLLHLPAAQRAHVRELVADVVAAVEQANAATPGPAKKQIALALLGDLLKQQKLNVSPTQLDVLLEAAVGTLNAVQVAGRAFSVTGSATTMVPFTPVTPSPDMPNTPKQA